MSKPLQSPSAVSLFDQTTEFLKNIEKDPSLAARLYAIRLYLEDISVPVIAKVLNVSRSAIRRWIRTIKEKGLEGLIRKKGSGRTPVLSSYEKEQIDMALAGPPEDHGFHVWDGKSLKSFIYREFDKKLSVRSCQLLLHTLGYSYTKPQSLPAPMKPNEEEREQFVHLIQEINQDPSLVLVWEDEVHFLAQAKTGYKWQKKGLKHIVHLKPGRDKVSYMGFLIPQTGQLFVYSPERFTYESMIAGLEEFLKDCPPPKGKQYCIVFDNAPWHAKMNRLVWKEKLPEYEKLRKSIKPVFLPRYSPDLNPIEQVWRITRREKTNNRTFSSKEGLSDCLNSYFAEHKVPNEQFRSLGSFRKYLHENHNQPENKSKTSSHEGKRHGMK